MNDIITVIDINGIIVIKAVLRIYKTWRKDMKKSLKDN